MSFIKWIFISLCIVSFVLACESRHDMGGTEKAPAKWRVRAKHYDHDGDGNTDETYRLRYDRAGRLTAYELDGAFGAPLFSSYDSARPDGKTDSAIRYRYDEKGRLVSNELDVDNDGKIEGAKNTSEGITHYAYDEEGRLIREEDDNMFGPEDKGVIDMVTHYTYDKGGRTTARRFDYNADGKVDAVESYIYDEMDRHVKTLSDFNNDGEPDGICTFTYGETGKKERKLCDGRKVSMYDSSPPDGTVDSTVKYFYDESGRMTREESDNDNDGAVDWLVRYTYDEFDNEIAFENFKGETHALTSAGRTEWEEIPPGTPEPVNLMPPIPLPR